MPRVLTAAAVGAGLALCGAVMQALTRNPLADPYLLGLSSGASVGAVIVIVLGVGLLLPLAAFAGALVALVATLALAQRRPARSTPTRTVLAGLAVSSVFGAITSLVIFWSATGDSYREILNWLLGSLAGTDWTSVAIAGGAMIVVGIPLLASARTLDAFAFGDTAAAALGVHVGRSRALLLGGTALLTGALVAVSGVDRVRRADPAARRAAPRRLAAPRAAPAVGARRRDLPGLGRHRARARSSTRASCRSASSPPSSAARCSPCLLLRNRRLAMSDARTDRTDLRADRVRFSRGRPAHHRRRRLHRARRRGRRPARSERRGQEHAAAPHRRHRASGCRYGAPRRPRPRRAAPPRSRARASRSPSRRCTDAPGLTRRRGRRPRPHPAPRRVRGPGRRRPCRRARGPRGRRPRSSSPTASTARCRAASASG